MTLTTASHAWLRRVSDYHSGAGSPAERAAVEAHLATCRECREALAMYRRFYTLAASPLSLGISGTARAMTEDDSTQPFTSTPASAPALTRPISSPTMPPARRNPRGPRGTLIGAIAAVLVVALLTTAFVALFLPRLRHPLAQPTPTVAPTLVPQTTMTPLPTLTPVPTVTPKPTATPIPTSPYQVMGEPVEANGVIYVTTQNGYLYALRASDGSQLWRFHSDGAYAGGSPTVANGVVYFGASNQCENAGPSASPYLYAINATTGALIWRVVGFAHSKLLVANGVIYSGACENGVAAYRTSDGSQVWTGNLGGGCYDGWFSTDGTDLFVNMNCVGLTALRLTDGSAAWANGNGNLIVGGGVPAVANGVVYFGNKAVRASDGTVLRTFPTSGGYDVVVNGVVFNDGGINGDSPALAAYNTTTGATMWQITTPNPQRMYGTGKGVLYTVDVESGSSAPTGGHLSAFQTSNGAQLWSVPIILTGPDGAPPSFGNTIYAGTPYGTVVALNASDGTTVWTTTLK